MIKEGGMIINKAEKKDTYVEDIRKEINEIINTFINQKKDFSETETNSGKEDGMLKDFLMSLYKTSFRESRSDGGFNFQRSLTQEQIDVIFDIINENLNENNSHIMSPFLFEFFTTSSKNNSSDKLEKNTPSDLFAKAFSNNLKSEKGINIDFLQNITCWAQNIHMVDPDVLFELLLNIITHPEKVSISSRYTFIMGVGLSPNLVEKLDKEYDKLNDTPLKLKSLEILRNLINLKNHAGFGDSANIAINIAEDKQKKENNYFLKNTLDQIVSVDFFEKKEKRLNLVNEYSDVNKEDGPDPLIIKNSLQSDKYFEKDRRAKSVYSKINNYIGVIYNEAFEVDSFFDLKTKDHIALKDILEKEGFFQEYNKSKNLEDIDLMYKTLISLPLRNKVEKDFNINFSDFSIREQIQFLNFISSKNIKDVEVVKNFILDGDSRENINNRFTSFLSLESDSGMGDRIMKIGNYFDNEKIANDIFCKYAEFVRKLNTNVDDLESLYQKIFFDKNIDKNKIINILSDRANQLLISAYETIENLSQEEAEKEVKTLLKQLDDEVVNKLKNIDELKAIADDLNKKYLEMTESDLNMPFFFKNKTIRLLNRYEKINSEFIFFEKLENFDDDLGFLNYFKTGINGSLKERLVVYLKGKSIISSCDNNVIRIVDNSEANRDLFYTYGVLDNLSLSDPDARNEFLKMEDYIYEIGHPITKNDFKYINKISDSDLKLLEKVFGKYQLDITLFERLGLNYFDLDLDEVLLFFRYIKDCNFETFERIIKYRKKYGLKPFLSMISGGHAMGDKILCISDHLSEKAAEDLFAGYNYFCERIDKNIKDSESLYSEIFFMKNIDKSILTNMLLSRASQLLSSSYDVIKNLSQEEAEKEVKTLLKQLDDEVVNKLKNIDELKAIAESLNSTYPEVLKLGITPEDVVPDSQIKNLSNSYDKETFEKNKTEYDQHKKFSSERIKEIIDLYQQLSETEDDGSEEKNKYEEVIAKLKKALPLQISLENKLDQVVYGYDLAKLPKDFNNFEKRENLSEKIPEKAPLFFPVGISKDLPSWEKVLAGEKQFAKPIDIYGYMFWLNNQNREISLIVCDEIQVNNYQIRYNKSKEEAKDLTIKIGNKEAEKYQKIIDTFALDNIKVIRYNNFINSNKEKFDHYEKIVGQLQNHPIFREMFLSMVQESVSGAEKSEYLGYANEELSWILSTNGTKIGHLNEARYDILAALIKNIESASEKIGVDAFSNLDSQQVLSIIQAVSKNLKDIINEEKSKLDKKSSPFLYFQRLQDHLNKINIDRKIEANKEVKKSDMILNFSCPDVGSASFGWRGADEKKESTIKFKEPYSTYFYESHQDLLIDSDQVVALGDGYISGKIMTLENSKQIDYAEKVVKPMLEHYLAVLDKAPSSYFEKIGKDKEEILEELQENQSLLDTLKFIQKYIIKPTE